MPLRLNKNFMAKGVLYIVATPIGNLGDITLRALETLKSADVILCEDTRQTQKLSAHYNIKKPLISYHHHSDEKKVKEIKEILNNGKSVALVTDAGTPGISDPGNKLISDLRLQIADLIIVPVPGASAVTTALSVSGFPTDRFLFLGFPPHKGRKKFFEQVAKSEYTVVFYESPYRIRKCLNELKELFSRNDIKICICRELTKKFESIYRGTIEEILKMNVPEKGEFTIIIQNAK